MKPIHTPLRMAIAAYVRACEPGEINNDELEVARYRLALELGIFNSSALPPADLALLATIALLGLKA